MTTQANLAVRQARFASEAGQRDANSPDWLLIGAVIALTVIGLVFVFSASVAVGQQLFGDPRYFAVRQLTGAVVGLIAFVALARLDYRRLRTWSPIILLIAIVALVAVLMPGIGVEQNGARRWMQIGPLPPVQPSEFAKLAVAIYVAAWLASRGPAIRHVTLGVVPFAVMVGFFGFLIMAEPDLGTALVIVTVAGAMFFIAGAALRHLLALTAVGGGVLFGIIANRRLRPRAVHVIRGRRIRSTSVGLSDAAAFNRTGQRRANRRRYRRKPAKVPLRPVRRTRMASSPSSGKKPGSPARCWSWFWSASWSIAARASRRALVIRLGCFLRRALWLGSPCKPSSTSVASRAPFPSQESLCLSSLSVARR